jgi:hypothetical protein
MTNYGNYLHEDSKCCGRQNIQSRNASQRKIEHGGRGLHELYLFFQEQLVNVRLSRCESHGNEEIEPGQSK